MQIAVETLYERARPDTVPQRPNASIPYFENSRPNNVLTYGFYEKKMVLYRKELGQGNANIETLKSHKWACLQEYIGSRLMLDLLLNTSVYLLEDTIGHTRARLEENSYIQLTGIHPFPHNVIFLHLTVLGPSVCETTNQRIRQVPTFNKTANQILLARQRMFYATPTLNQDGNVCFGLPADCGS